MNNLKFFDFEVLPEWWCCVVSDEEETYPGGLYNNKFDNNTEYMIKSKMRVYTSDEDLTEVREDLKTDLSKAIICGYNIKKYDLIIAKCIFAGFTPRKVYIASQILINPALANLDAEYMRVASFIRFGWSEAEAWQDLLDDSDKSLKDKECSLGMDIRESTVPFDKVNLTQKDKDELIFYCKHDVYALHVLYVTTSKAYIDTKISLCDTFGLSRKIGYKNTNANLCGKVLEAQRVHGTAIVDPTITIRDKALYDYLDKWLPKDIFNHLLTKKEAKTFELFDNVVDIGDGGLHSVYKIPKDCGLYVESTDEYSMYNVDVSSCYPSVMMFCNAMSRAIKKPERFHYIYKRRLDLKLTPKSEWSKDDKVFVPAAKLVLNTTYGAMGNKYLDLYDDYMRTKVCRVGQMILIAISNNLYQSIPGLKVIQTNTDGVLVYAKRSDYDKIMAIVNEFSALSQFVFEVEEDNRLWQLNVNNYVAVHPDGEVKNKGGAFILEVYQKGTNKLRPLGNFCVPRAQMDFYVNGTNPVKHLLNNKTVSDFCLSCTKGPGYTHMVQYNKNGAEMLGKVSRVLAVTDESLGIIKKVKTIKKEDSPRYGEIQEDTVALCPPHALIMNDDLNNYYIDKSRIYHKPTGKSWEIDYGYYCDQLDNVLDVIWYKLKDEQFAITEEFNI